jgi:GNAT superfamily N-acetyltransferase
MKHVAMAIRITESEFHHVIALQRSMLVEAGLGSWEIEPWLTKMRSRLARDHHDGTGAYFVKYIDGNPVGMAGALLRDYHAFLSLKTGRYGYVADEYILPANRGRGLPQQLHAAAVAWILQNGATVLETTPPNVARLAVHNHAWKL